LLVMGKRQCRPWVKSGAGGGGGGKKKSFSKGGVSSGGEKAVGQGMFPKNEGGEVP